MPVRTLMPVPFDSHENDLLLKLIAEWKNPQPEGEPDIALEETGMGTRVYVIWSAWEGVNPTDRSEIITRAYELVHGADNAELLTMALGLTPDESARSGLPHRVFS